MEQISASSIDAATLAIWSRGVDGLAVLVSVWQPAHPSDPPNLPQQVHN